MTEKERNKQLLTGTPVEAANKAADRDREAVKEKDRIHKIAIKHGLAPFKDGQR